MNSQRKIIAIVGTTASGKTGIGVNVARKFNGEIVSADSRQIFRGLDIGTGKDLVEYDEIPYHMIDICEPGEDFSMFKWVDQAKIEIEKIFEMEKIPVIVGGTGLYIQALVEGFQLKKIENTDTDSEKYDRDQLESFSILELQKILNLLSPETLEKIDQQNPHRLIRAIEKAQSGLESIKIKPDFEVLQIGIDWPRDTLYSRIDKRVESRFSEGMLEEIIGLLNDGVSAKWLLKLGLEYREITNFVLSVADKYDLKSISKQDIEQIKKTKDFSNMKQQLKFRIHQFARRQETWFKRFPEIVWENNEENIEKIIKDFLV